MEMGNEMGNSKSEKRNFMELNGSGESGEGEYGPSKIPDLYSTNTTLRIRC